MTYGDGPPSADGSNELHSVTQGELKRRLAREGPTEKLIANLCIVAAYQYWESNYRAKISAGLRLDAPLESAIFGDLRRVRHWILHQRAIAGDDAGRLELLTWWKPGDSIALDLRMLTTAFGHIRDELQVLHQRAQEIPGGKSA